MSQFDVVLKGVLAGYDAQQVQIDFAKLFSLDAEKTARLFGATRAVLKSGVDESTAQKYIDRLAAIGVDAVAESKAEQPIAESPIIEQPPESNHTESSPPAAVPVSTESQVAEAGVDAESVDTAPVADASGASSDPRVLPFVFTGKGFEYFKIWIVNLLLSIVTLGIYSAWAKVRNKQYFYGNTHLADATFEYTAEPLKILTGRIIAFVLYIALALSPRISLGLYAVVFILFLIFLPWIIVSSLRFNARHTSYRNIPFRFTGTVWGATKTFLLWPILAVFSLGLLFPVVWKRQAQYVTNNHSYGSEPFKFDVSVGEYYKLLLFAFVAASIFGVIVMMCLGTSLTSMVKPDGTFNTDEMFSLISIGIGYFFFYFGVGAYFVVSLANIHFNNTHLHTHKFQSNWKLPTYFWLLLSNTFAILLTLGLFIPFAKVRTAAYRAEHTAFAVTGSMDNFVALERDKTNALGEGVHDLFDIDISI